MFRLPIVDLAHSGEGDVGGNRGGDGGADGLREGGVVGEFKGPDRRTTFAVFASFAASSSGSREFFPRNPARTGRRIWACAFYRHAVALGIAFDLEGFLVPELDVASPLPPAAGRALLVREVDFLHCCLLVGYQSVGRLVLAILAGDKEGTCPPPSLAEAPPSA